VELWANVAHAISFLIVSIVVFVSQKVTHPSHAGNPHNGVLRRIGLRVTNWKINSPPKYQAMQNISE
jgi:hypothetical protein